MATIDDFRRFPQFAELSDSGIINALSSQYGVSQDELASEFGVARNDPGFVTGVKQGLGGFATGIGRVVDDVTGGSKGAITRYGEDVAFRNPSSAASESWAGFKESPWQGVKEIAGSAVGSTLPSMVPFAGQVGKGTSVVGRGLAIGRTLPAQTALAATPVYGGIRQAQDQEGISDIPRAALASVGAGVVESKLGIQGALARNAANRAVAKEVAEFGATPWKTAGKSWLRQGVEEGGEEILQQPMQQWAAHQDVTSDKSLRDTGWSGFQGVVGGLAMGPLAAGKSGLRHAQIRNNISTDLLNIDQPFAQQQNLAEYEREFRNKKGEDGSSWYGDFMRQQLAARNQRTDELGLEQRRDAYNEYLAAIDARANQERAAASRNPEAYPNQFGTDQALENLIERRAFGLSTAQEQQDFWGNVPDPALAAGKFDKRGRYVGEDSPYQQFWHNVAPTTEAMAASYGATPDMFGGPHDNVMMDAVDAAWDATEFTPSPAVPNKRQMSLDFEQPSANPTLYGSQLAGVVHNQMPITDKLRSTTVQPSSAPAPKQKKLNKTAQKFESFIEESIAAGHIDGNHQIVKDWIASNKSAKAAKDIAPALLQVIEGGNKVVETSEAKLAREGAKVAPDDVEDPVVAEGIRMFQAGDTFRTIASNLGGSHQGWSNKLAALGYHNADRVADANAESLDTQTSAATEETPESATVGESPDVAPSDYTNNDEHVDNEAEQGGVTIRSRMDAGAATAATTDEKALKDMKRKWSEAPAAMKARITDQLKTLGVSVSALNEQSRAAYLGIVQKEGRSLTAADVDQVAKLAEALNPVAKESKLLENRKAEKEAAQLAEDRENVEKGVEALLAGDKSVAKGLLELLGGDNSRSLMQWLHTYAQLPAKIDTPKAAVEHFIIRRNTAHAKALAEAEQVADIWGEGFDKLSDENKIDFSKTVAGMGDLIYSPGILRQMKEDINGTTQADPVRQGANESTGRTESTSSETQRPDTARVGESGADQSRTPEVKVRKKRTIAREVAYESQGDPNPELEAPVNFFNTAFDKLAQTPVFSYLSSMVDRFILVEDPSPKMSFDSHDGAWRVTTGFLGDPDLMGGWRSHALDFYMHHEMGHAVDGAGASNRFASRKELNLSAHMDAEGTLHVIPASPAAKEMLSLWERFKGKNSVGDELTYVFGQSGGVVSQAKACDDTGAANVTSLAKSELFAQMFAFYNHSHVWASLGGMTSREFLKREAPAAHRFMESVQNEIEKDITRAAQFKARTEANDSIGERETTGETTKNNAGGRLGIAPQEYEALGLGNEVSVTRAADYVENYGGASARKVFESSTHAVKQAFRSLMSLHDLVDSYAKVLPSAKEWYKSVRDTIATRTLLEADAESIAARADKRGINRDKVNDFISKSTLEQLWGYDAEFDRADGTKRKVTADPRMKLEFTKLNAQEQQIVKDVFAHGEKMQAAKFAIMKELGLKDLMPQTGSLQGPYAPLKRFGGWLSVQKSEELVNAEDNMRKDPTTENKNRVAELKKDPTHYVVSSHDTRALSSEAARNAAKDGWFYSQHFRKVDHVKAETTTNPALLQKVRSAIKAEGLAPDVRAQLDEMITNMYLQAFDEHNARMHGKKRNNTAGYEKDMVRSFLAHAKAEAGFLANMKHGGATNDAFYKMQREAAGNKTDREGATDAFDMISAHYAANLKQTDTPIQDATMALTSLQQLATNPAYHIQNLMQPLMVSVPRLAADFGNYAGAWSHMLSAYRQANKIGFRNIDLNNVKDANLRAALEECRDSGLLDVGMAEDLGHLESTKTGIKSLDTSTRAAKSVVHTLRQVARTVEAVNRVSTAIAAYQMATANGKNPEDAKAYTVSVLQDTQGDFSRTDSPLILKKLPKVVGQYRKFQLMMMAHYAKSFHDAIKGESPEVKAVGRRALAYSLGHAFTAAGLLGMPLANIVGLVFKAVGGDDEPKDLERWMRENLGDDGFAQMLIHGPMWFLGMDAKLSQDKVFSILPYADWDLTSKEGVKNLGMGLAGPAGSNLMKMADGVDSMKSGDYYDGLEKLLPSGISNALKAFRVANEGYTLNNGDLMVRPDDVNGFVLAMDALGVKSPEMRKMDWFKNQQYEIKRFYIDRTKEVQQEYAAAVKDGDTDAAAEARDHWMDLQAGKDNLRLYFNDSHEELKKQPLSTLLKYPQTQAKREAKLQKSIPQ